MKIKGYIDGEIRNYNGIPSVTGLLGLLEMGSLDYIKNLPNYDRIMKEASNRGTYIHKFIEKYLQGDIYRIVKKYREYTKSFIKYISCIDLENSKIELETEIIEDQFGGTIDCILTDQDGYSTIIDWKTSGSETLNHELLMKYKLQLGAYRKLLDMNGYNVQGGIIVILTEKGYKAITLNKYDLQEYESNFGSIYWLYKSIIDGDSLPSTINGTWVVAKSPGELNAMNDTVEENVNETLPDPFPPVYNAAIPYDSEQVSEAREDFEQVIEAHIQNIESHTSDQVDREMPF